MRVTIQDKLTGRFAPAIVDATNCRFALEADIDFASDPSKAQCDAAELDRFLRFLGGANFEPCLYADIEEINGYEGHQMVGSAARITTGDCDADFDWNLDDAFSSRTFQAITPHGMVEHSVEKFLARELANAYPDGKIPDDVRVRVNEISEGGFSWKHVSQSVVARPGPAY